MKHCNAKSAQTWSSVTCQCAAYVILVHNIEKPPACNSCRTAEMLNGSSGLSTALTRAAGLRWNFSRLLPLSNGPMPEELGMDSWEASQADVAPSLAMVLGMGKTLASMQLSFTCITKHAFSAIIKILRQKSRPKSCIQSHNQGGEAYAVCTSDSSIALAMKITATRLPTLGRELSLASLCLYETA